MSLKSNKMHVLLRRVYLMAQNGLNIAKGWCGTTMSQSLCLKFSDLELNFISTKRDGQIKENWQENYK